MNILAIVDVTDVDAPRGPATEVAGLSLLERTIRLAAVCGADEIIVVIHDDDRSRYQSLIDDSHIDVPLKVHTPEDDLCPTGQTDLALVIDAGAVFDRALVNRALEEAKTAPPGTYRRTPEPHLAVIRTDSSTNLQEALQEPAEVRRTAPPRISGGWTERIDSASAVRRAERRLWNSCRKPQDGLVSRYFNRHFSLAISRALASTSVRPNHVTVVTFALGIIAAAAAVYGGYYGFLAAGILYQLNSIVDGVDGELARVRYEFSTTGEWLDTIADDLADLLMYIGVGIGAWRTLADAPGPFGAELWLVLGIVAGAAKLASMLVYYRWLAARGRGDLLAFEWSFEDDEHSESATGPDEVLRIGRYFFRKDFIVFVAMVLSFGGFLPHLLFVLAPGNAVVAISVVLQQRNKTSTRRQQ